MAEENRTAGQREFIDQKTRELMTVWCHKVIQGLSLTDEGKPWPHDLENVVYFQHAKDKGWINDAGTKILSPGWDTASRFLKR